MAMSNIRVRAVVRVIAEIEADSVWGGDTTWEQIAKQAEDGVRGLLTNNNAAALAGLTRRIRSLEFVGVNVRPEDKVK